MSEETILAAIAALDAKMTTLDSRVTSLDAKYGALDGKLTTFRVDVLARFDRIENRLTAMGDDMIVTMGRADRAHSAADHVRDELRQISTEVSALARKTRRLEAQIDDITRPHA